jgi:ankyrin repeat protein
MPFDESVGAVYRKDYSALERLLATGNDINSKGQDDRTLLMHAILAEDTDVEMIRFLIEHGADVNTRDQGQEWTPLAFAARDQNVEAVRELLRAGALPESRDVFGNTPLFRAVMNRLPSHELVKMLLNAGADPRRKNNYDVSPLDLAVTMGNTEIAALLEGRR